MSDPGLSSFNEDEDDKTVANTVWYSMIFVSLAIISVKLDQTIFFLVFILFICVYVCIYVYVYICNKYKTNNVQENWNKLDKIRYR